MSDVVLRLEQAEEEALRHELSEPYGQEIRGGVIEKLRVALDSPPVEERVEYRPTSADKEGRKDIHPDAMSLEKAQRFAGRRRDEWKHTNVRIQSRTTTQLSDGSALISPWSDLTGEEGQR